MSRKEALRAVRLERGSLEASKEIVRSGGWESVVDALWRDLLFAARTLRKKPRLHHGSICDRMIADGLRNSRLGLFALGFHVADQGNLRHVLSGNLDGSRMSSAKLSVRGVDVDNFEAGI